MNRSLSRQIASMYVSTSTPGWLQVPGDLPEVNAAAWGDAAFDGLIELWDVEVDADLQDQLREMLRASLSLRGDGDFVFEVWPWRAPVRSRVRVSCLRSEGMPDWGELGFTVVPTDSAGLGPGMLATRSESVEIEDGQATMFESWAVFDDGELSVVVQVDPCPQEVYMSIFAGLQGLIDSTVVEFTDGTSFAGRPAPLFVDDRADEWPDAGEDGSRG